MVTVTEHRVSKQHSAFGLISDKLFGDLPLWLHQMSAECKTKSRKDGRWRNGVPPGDFDWMMVPSAHRSVRWSWIVVDAGSFDMGISPLPSAIAKASEPHLGHNLFLRQHT
jgi:hypothetical protein